MAITLVGEAIVPTADNGSVAWATGGVAITPPVGMQADDYVLVVAHYKGTGTTLSVAAGDGQTWTSEADQESVATGYSTRLFRCKFNGTWSANPIFTKTGTGTLAYSIRMIVFRGVDPTNPIDVAYQWEETASSNTQTAPSLTTVTNGAVVVHFLCTSDDNTFSLDTAGWNAFNPLYVRNLSGNDQATAGAYKVIATAGASGTCQFTLTALGPEVGQIHSIALKPGGATTFFITPSGGLTPTATRTKLTAAKRTAGATPAAGLVRLTGSKSVGGIMSSATGTYRKIAGKLLSSAMTPTGTVAKIALKLKVVAGAIASVGALPRQVRKALTAGMTPTGALSRFIARRLTGSITPAGALSMSAVKLKAIAGAIMPTGALIRLPALIRAGTIDSIGTLLRQTRRTLSGTLTMAGTARRLVARLLAGAMSSAGAVVNVAAKVRAFAGSVTPAGTVLKQLQRRYVAAIGSVGTLIRMPSRRATGAVTFAGTLASVRARTIAVAGSLASAGTIVRRASKSIAASLTPAGTLLKLAARRLLGSIASSGAVATVRSDARIAIAGTLTTAGTVRRSIGKAIAGVLASTGSLRQFARRVFSGVIGFIGALAKTIVAPPSGNEARLNDLRAILAAADPTMRVDYSASEPFRFERETLYVWEETVAPNVRQAIEERFNYIAVVAMSDRGGQASQINDRVATELLDARASLLMNALRSNQQGAEWDYLTQTLDSDYLATYGMRGFAIRISGYRIG